MKNFRGMYKGKWYEVDAESVADAQAKIAKMVKAKKVRDVHGIHLNNKESYEKLCRSM